MAKGRRLRQLGIFLDGSRADLDDANPTSVARLSKQYEGASFYRGGPGTYLGRLGYYVGGWLGFGIPGRIEDALEVASLNDHECCDAFGFSRGGDAAYLFAFAYANKFGRPLRFLGLFDPVPARGLSSLRRIIPWAPIPLFLPRPPCEVLAIVKAKHNPSKLYRSNGIDGLLSTDESHEYPDPFNHSKVGRSVGPRTRVFEHARLAGVRWRK